MKNIFDIDKKSFKLTTMYNLFFFIASFALLQIFAAVTKLLAGKLGLLIGPDAISQLTTETAKAPLLSANSLLLFMFVLAIGFILGTFYLYAFFENLSWNTIVHKSTNFKNTSKFLALFILSLLSLVLIDAAVFFLATLFGGILMNIIAIFFFICVLFSAYLLYVSYISFAHTHEIFKSIKNMFVIGVTKIKLTWLPLIIALVIGILINLILLLFTWTGVYIYTSLQVLSISVYIAWFRLYLANSLKSVKF